MKLNSIVRYSIVMITAEVGILLFVLSFYYFPSNILMILTGLTLIISAVSFAYTTSTRMVQARVITSQISSLTLTLNRLLKEAGYEGKTCFLPPQLPGEPPVQLIGSKPIIPTGLHLESIFEKETGVDFFSIDLKQLEELLVKVIVDKLEIASGFGILDKDGVIYIRMKGFALYEFYNYLQETTSQDYLSLSPTVSALACAIAKATKKAVWIDQVFLRKQNLEIKFRYGSTDVGVKIP